MIDADKLPYEDIESIDGYTYMCVNAYDIEHAPTIEQSEDCISRETATAKLFQSMMIKSSEFGNELSSGEKKFNDGLRKAVEIIRSLPNIQPQPKSGKWIDVDATHSQCDKCLAVFEIISANGEANFCPNCGAKMEVEGWKNSG